MSYAKSIAALIIGTVFVPLGINATTPFGDAVEILIIAAFTTVAGYLAAKRKN